MTPADKDEVRRMLANAMQPLQEEIDAIKIADDATASLHQQVADLKARNAKLSGQHRQVSGNLTQFKTEANEDRATDLTAVAAAIKTLIDVTKENKERQVRTDENVAAILQQNQAALVKVTDEKGTVLSIKPASMVAAESSVRTEDKQTAMAVDVDTTEKTSRATQRWQKRVTTPLLVLVPILVEIYRQLFPHH